MLFTSKLHIFLFSLIVSIACLSLSSCYLDEDENVQMNTTEDTPISSVKVFPLADQALWTYFEQFEKEAARRNLSYNLTQLEITGVIEAISEDGVAGTCQYGQHIYHVTIDDHFWKNASPLKREMVVFHELGHCVLNKNHTEDANRENVCLSIMNSGTGSCQVAYTSQNRSYYLDEFFANID